MNTELSSETEYRILDAAVKVFVRKGRQGSSMQDIADEAGINRTLLNYYFRSKDKLFDLIFQKVLEDFIPEMAGMMTSDDSLETKIHKFIENYTHFLLKSPNVPVFIIHELSDNPERLINLFKTSGINPEIFLNQARAEMDAGKIRKMKPKQLLINLLSLVIFPYLARPLIEGMFFEGNQEEYRIFLEERSRELAEYFIQSIKINDLR